MRMHVDIVDLVLVSLATTCICLTGVRHGLHAARPLRCAALGTFCVLLYARQQSRVWRSIGATIQSMPSSQGRLQQRLRRHDIPSVRVRRSMYDSATAAAAAVLEAAVPEAAVSDTAVSDTAVAAKMAESEIGMSVTKTFSR